MKPSRTRLFRQNSSTSGNGYTYYNKTFDDINDLFLFVCTHGDYMLVQRLLEQGDVKADVSNRLGKTALHLSIENEHLEVVRVLLDVTPYEKFRDALLLAIYMGHTNIAMFILEHPMYRTFSGGFLDPTDLSAYDDSQFSSEISSFPQFFYIDHEFLSCPVCFYFIFEAPIILAAQHNRLQIVHQLLIRGERIKRPHSHRCSCDQCLQDFGDDPFRHSHIRLSAYKGLASEVYLSLTSPDPILEAFELRQEMIALAKREHHFCQDYKKLARQLSMFVARLLDNIRGCEELEIVLNKTGKIEEEKYETLARFDLAIHYREKLFVAHPNCQQKLMEKWYDNLSIIHNVHVFKRTAFYVTFLVCYPFVALAFYLFPKTKVGSLCQQANLKFKAYIASYFIFIALIMGSSFFSAYYLGKSDFLSNYDTTIYTNYIRWIFMNDEFRRLFNVHAKNSSDTVLNCDISIRLIYPNPFQIIIFIWVIGFFWNEVKQIFSVGPRVYLKVLSNYVDCSMNILYIFHFIFLYSSMLLTRTSLDEFRSDTYWKRMTEFRQASEDEKQLLIKKTSHLLYWINADRFYWRNGDLQNIAEAFFAMGNVFSICRICFLLPIIPFVGPLQVMVERMITDIAKWATLACIFFIAFACSLFFFYSPYAISNDRRQDESQTKIFTQIWQIYNKTIVLSNSNNCPSIFYELIDRMLVTINLNNSTSNLLNSTLTNANKDFCSQTSNYEKLVEIGHFPAITYFGQSLQATTLTLFFTLFGVIGENNIPGTGYELLPAYCYKPDPTTYLDGFDQFMTVIGFLLYGMFTFICVTVLINTLIVMLEQSIDKIDDHADVEWKFARSKLYMEYIRSGNNLPVPLNIFPSPKEIIDGLCKFKAWLYSKQKPTQNIPKRENKIELSSNIIRLGSGYNGQTNIRRNRTLRQRRSTDIKRLTYPTVVDRIVKRFLLYYQSTHQGLDEIKDGFEFREVKQDISSLRHEICHELDVLETIYGSIKHSMAVFNANLNDEFPIEKIKNDLQTAKK